MYGFRVVVVALPDLTVEQPAGNNLTNGTATVNFGAVAISTNSERVFTIRSSGPSSLSGLALTVDGVNPEDFIIGSSGSPVLMPGATTTFTVTFAPSGATSGSRSLFLPLSFSTLSTMPRSSGWNHTNPQSRWPV